MGYTPKALPLELIGDRVFLATQSIEKMPDMVRPGEGAPVGEVGGRVEGGVLVVREVGVDLSAG